MTRSSMNQGPGRGVTVCRVGNYDSNLARPQSRFRITEVYLNIYGHSCVYLDMSISTFVVPDSSWQLVVP
jgi:hypothetical protein